jgi:hypothetical protein
METVHSDVQHRMTVWITYMTRRDVLSTKKIQKDSPKAEDDTFWSDPS